MATYDLEEQEQISELKTWWRMHGNVVIAALLAVVIGVAGWQFWVRYQRNQTEQATVIYAAVQKAAAAHDAKKARDAAGELLEKFPGTTYAALAALISARLQFDAGDVSTTKIQLQWVIDKAADSGLRDLARLHLAHVLFDEKAADEALKLLATEPDPAFAPRYAELKGDILATQGKKPEARAAYQAALAKLEALKSQREANYHELLQMKLDAIGGK